jgi:DNA-binding protein H-NS
MARIDQQADGTFSKVMSDTERKLLGLIVQVQQERINSEAKLIQQINQLQEQITQQQVIIDALKLKVDQLTPTTS